MVNRLLDGCRNAPLEVQMDSYDLAIRPRMEMQGTIRTSYGKVPHLQSAGGWTVEVAMPFEHPVSNLEKPEPFKHFEAGTSWKPKLESRQSLRRFHCVASLRTWKRRTLSLEPTWNLWSLELLELWCFGIFVNWQRLLVALAMPARVDVWVFGFCGEIIQNQSNVMNLKTWKHPNCEGFKVGAFKATKRSRLYSDLLGRCFPTFIFFHYTMPSIKVEQQDIMNRATSKAFLKPWTEQLGFGILF